MAHRVFNLAAICSLVAASAFAAAWPWASHIDPATQRIVLPGGWYASLDAYGPERGRVVFFNDPLGPYCGGILWNAGSSRDKGVLPNTPQPVSFGEAFGVYYRSIPSPPSPGGTRWWKTLRVSLAYPLVLTIALPIVWLFRHRSSTRRSHGFPVDGHSAAV